jgi:hypothetical protein
MHDHLVHPHIYAAKRKPLTTYCHENDQLIAVKFHPFPRKYNHPIPRRSLQIRQPLESRRKRSSTSTYRTFNRVHPPADLGKSRDGFATVSKEKPTPAQLLPKSPGRTKT